MEIDSAESDNDGPVCIAKAKRQGKMFSSVFPDLLLGSDLFRTTIQALLQFAQNVYAVRGVNWWPTPPRVPTSQPCFTYNIQNTTNQCFLQSLQLRFHLHRGHLLATAGVD